MFIIFGLILVVYLILRKEKHWTIESGLCFDSRYFIVGVELDSVAVTKRKRNRWTSIFRKKIINYFVGLN